MRSCKVCNAETHPTFLSLVPKAAFWGLSPATLPEGLPPACTGPGAAMVGSGSSSPNMASYTMDCSRNPIWDWLLQGFLRLRAALIEGPYQCGFSGDPSLQLFGELGHWDFEICNVRFGKPSSGIRKNHREVAGARLQALSEIP